MKLVFKIKEAVHVTVTLLLWLHPHVSSQNLVNAHALFGKGHPWKFIYKKFQIEASSKILYLEDFPIYNTL